MPATFGSPFTLEGFEHEDEPRRAVFVEARQAFAEPPAIDLLTSDFRRPAECLGNAPHRVPDLDHLAVLKRQHRYGHRARRNGGGDADHQRARHRGRGRRRRRRAELTHDQLAEGEDGEEKAGGEEPLQDWNNPEPLARTKRVHKASLGRVRLAGESFTLDRTGPECQAEGPGRPGPAEFSLGRRSDIIKGLWKPSR